MTEELPPAEITCPKCRLLNPPEAERCDCGYDFRSRTMQKSYNNPKTSGQTPSRGGGASMKIGLVLLVAGLGLTIATYMSAVRSGGTYLVAYGPVIAGVAMILRALSEGRNR